MQVNWCEEEIEKQNIIATNKALHLTAIPLRSIQAERRACVKMSALILLKIKPQNLHDWGSESTIDPINPLVYIQASNLEFLLFL
jgi:hypothetical protein